MACRFHPSMTCIFIFPVHELPGLVLMSKGLVPIVNVQNKAVGNPALLAEATARISRKHAAAGWRCPRIAVHIPTGESLNPWPFPKIDLLDRLPMYHPP